MITGKISPDRQLEQMNSIDQKRYHFHSLHISNDIHKEECKSNISLVDERSNIYFHFVKNKVK